MCGWWTRHSDGTTESVSVYTSRSKVHGSSSRGRNVTLAVICAMGTKNNSSISVREIARRPAPWSVCLAPVFLLLAPGG